MRTTTLFLSITLAFTLVNASYPSDANIGGSELLARLTEEDGDKGEVDPDVLSKFPKPPSKTPYLIVSPPSVPPLSGPPPNRWLPPLPPPPPIPLKNPLRAAKAQAALTPVKPKTGHPEHPHAARTLAKGLPQDPAIANTVTSDSTVASAITGKGSSPSPQGYRGRSANKKRGDRSYDRRRIVHWGEENE
ncbi:hypothetical protein F5050DRAFT_1710797 [Lentinula boryana]|uniref:Uncharacterized protein n=1 Tax=Lentinula boryana TaxID=40481 RepID=A0ABQ8QHW5_9AGAR|nr:hypothetical protein F5050DRAFT_1710797 [Lentinula boryana]